MPTSPVYFQTIDVKHMEELNMAHAFTAIMNGRDVRPFLHIPDNLLDCKILLTVDPIDKPQPLVPDRLQALFANASHIRIPKNIAIDSLMDEITIPTLL
jgi:hypothetical protein